MSTASFFDYPGTSDSAEAAALIFLADWSDTDWDKLLAHTQTHRFHEGQTVLQAGDVDRTMYVVAEGSLEVLTGTGRRQRRLVTIEAGSVVGEQGFIDGQPRSVNVRAITDVEMLSFSLDDYEILAGQEPDLARSFLFEVARILATRLRNTTLLVTRGR